jgi:hypothetical protein
MDLGLAKPQRRAVRRAVRTRCQAVSSDFDLLGERALDVSPRGMLVACDVPVALGEQVIVSFELPGVEPAWFDAEAEIARIIYGFRLGDPGYCAGFRFTYLERVTRQELLARLAGVPPPVPQRRPGLGRSRFEPQSVVRAPVVSVNRPRAVFPAGVLAASV